MSIPRLLLKREQQPSGIKKEAPWLQVLFLLSLIAPLRESPRVLKYGHGILEALDIIFCNAFPSV